MGTTDSTAASRAYVTRLQPRWQLTIPQPVRDALSLDQGDSINLMQVGDLILLMPRQPRRPALAEQFTALMEEEGVTLAELLAGLAEAALAAPACFNSSCAPGADNSSDNRQRYSL